MIRNAGKQSCKYKKIINNNTYSKKSCQKQEIIDTITYSYNGMT